MVARHEGDLGKLGGEPASEETGEYIEGIRKGDVIGVFVLADGRIAHRAFLMRRSRTLDILGAPDGAVLLGHAYTVPRFRGRGYQKLSIAARMNEAWELGAESVISETAPDNVPSMRALESAGLNRSGTLSVLVVANRLVFRRSTGAWKPAPVGWCRADGTHHVRDP